MQTSADCPTTLFRLRELEMQDMTKGYDRYSHHCTYYDETVTEKTPTAVPAMYKMATAPTLLAKDVIIGWVRLALTPGKAMLWNEL